MSMSPLIGEAEAQCQREFHRQRERKLRAQWWADLRHQIFSRVRGVFIFLLGATIVVFTFSHRMEINTTATQKISRMAAQVKVQTDSSQLRQSTLNYEKEVEEAAR